MKIYLQIIFLFLINFEFIFCTAHFVNLGKNCEPAWYNSYFQLRKEAFPFDWLIIKDFNSILKIFSTDFKYFLDKNYLVKNGDKVTNKYYNLDFVHDFPNDSSPNINQNSDVCTVANISENFLNYLDIVQEKYKRRISRLLNYLNNGELVIFARTHIIPDDAKKFVNLIKLKYPKANFLLIVAHNNSDYNYDWKIEKVKNYFSPVNTSVSRFNSQWFTKEFWQSVFVNLGYKI